MRTWAVLAAMVLIEQFDPAVDDRRLRACFEIVSAAHAADDPTAPPRSFGGFASWWAHGYNSNPRQAWLATNDAGDPVGCYLLELPDRENLALAQCFLVVAPDRRRRGAGTELLAHCVGQARLADRSRLCGGAREGSPGAAFATIAGATSGIAEEMRHLRVDDTLRERLGPLRSEAEQATLEYTTFSWLGAAAEERLAAIARLNAAMADAPHDEGIEPESWDPDRIKAMEGYAIDAGMRLYSVAARSEATGEMAALTQIATDPGTPGWGFQQLTAVLPDHRGHRLGLLVKIEMLDLLTSREPDVTRIFTGNARLNAHMITINHKLGFELSSAYRSWELALS